MFRFKLAEGLGKNAFIILDALGLVNDHKVVLDFAEDFLLSENHLVGGEEDVVVASVDLGHFDVFSVLDVPVEHEHPRPWKPLVELPQPFIYRNFRGDNYMVVVTRRL